MIFKKKEKTEQTPQEILAAFRALEKKVDKLEKIISGMEKENESVIQKVGLIRFNPFSGTGGDQSFSIALLNKKMSGVVFTSFYTRENSSVYGKPIEKGKSSYILSEEEERAIELAMEDDTIFKKISGRKRKNA